MPRMTLDSRTALKRSPARQPRLPALVMGALGLALLLPPLFHGLSLPGQRALLVTLITIVLWTTRWLDSGATALLGVTLLALTGAVGELPRRRSRASRAPCRTSWSASSRSASRSRRAGSPSASRATSSTARAAGRSPCTSSSCSRCPVLTFLLPSATTRSGILVHIYEEVFGRASVPAGAGIVKAVMLALSSINRLASTALLTGGITPVMAAAIIGGMSWTGWLALLAVPYYALLALGAVLTWALYRRGFGRAAAPSPITRAPRRCRRRSGGRSPIVAGTGLLWLTDAWHHLDPAVPALLASSRCSRPASASSRGAISIAASAGRNFFVIGASISLAHALGESGAAAWLARGCSSAACPGWARSRSLRRAPDARRHRPARDHSEHLRLPRARPAASRCPSAARRA